jgi:hypothetical protein
MVNSKKETKKVPQHHNSRGFVMFKKLEDPRCRGLMGFLSMAGSFQLRFDWDGFFSMIPHKTLKTKGAFSSSKGFFPAIRVRGNQRGGSHVLSSKNFKFQRESKKSRYAQVIEPAVLG